MMTSFSRWWNHLKERRARKRRAVDIWWLSRLCEYHIEGRNHKDYRDEIDAHLRFICKDYTIYKVQFPDIDRRIFLSRSVLKAPSVADEAN